MNLKINWKGIYE